MQETALHRLNQGYRIITATPRLARELTHQYAQLQIAAGKNAWIGPSICSYDHWLNDAWQRFCQLNNNPPQALNTIQSRRLWQSIIETDLRSREERILCNIDALTEQSMQAYQIMMKYHIDINACHYSSQSDHRQFALWASNYQHILKQHQYIDRNQLSEHIQSASALHKLDTASIFGDKLYFCGFDHAPPQIVTLLNFLKKRDIEIAQEQINATKPEKTQYYAFKDSDSQYRHVANWAWHKLREQPDSRIAIIVPDLAPVREKIARYLRQRLNSDTFYHGIDGEASFHIALGKKLGQYRLIRHAMQLLLPWHSDMENVAFTDFLLNPILKGHDSEKSARALLDQKLRTRLRFSGQWQQFVKEIRFYCEQNESSNVPHLQECLSEIDTQLDRISGKQTFRQWAQCFTETLNVCGWNELQGLNSQQFQIADAFNETLRELSSIDNLPMSQKVSAAQALSVLNSLLQQNTFQSESTYPPLEVLSINEAAGIEADAIWFADCDNNKWPPAPRPNAFLPITQQRKQGYYAASSELYNEYAEKLMLRLYQQNIELTFSYSEYDDDQWAAPCAMISKPTALAPDESDLWQYLNQQALQIERIQEEQWVTPSEAERKIGSYVLQDQSLCPFKAFARHRLGATFEAHREDGLTSAEQGTILHLAMQNFFEKHADIRRLKQMDEAAIKDAITDITMQLKSRLSGQYGLGNAVQQFQLEFLNTQMHQWLAQEFCRLQNFKVVATEAAYQFTLDGIQFRLKIDRIDQLNDGSFVLIDYKTGAYERAQKWFGERLEAPQMPLYFISLAHADPDKYENLSAVTYAIVHNHRCQYIGLSSHEDFSISSGLPDQPDNKVQLPEKALSRIEPELQWQDLFEYWQEKIEILCQEYTQGVATVTPYKQACQYCDLQLLCRIEEREDIEPNEEELFA